TDGGRRRRRIERRGVAGQQSPRSRRHAIRDQRRRRQLNDVTRAFFTKTASIETPAMGAAMRALVANPNDAASAATVSKDPRYNSMLRTTCVATMLQGGHATNALPQTAQATVNCRMVFFEPVEGLTRVLFGNVPVIPIMGTGATDSRSFRR